MAATDKLFAGSIPEIYDQFLVPLIFESYARDLAERLARLEPREVLETAAGTGVLTRAMASRLPAQARIVATDLNQPMLNHAQGQSHDGRITWRQADALALPFEDRRFDAVACQFGAMFFPDKVQGYREARRVLKRGASFSTCGTASRKTSLPMSSRKRWRRSFRRTRLASWPASRTAITMWKRSARN
jgi:ubiquinone/menaquinone biosynthesis C-methylase UbiE